MPSLSPLEIQALAKIIDELDYYQLLHLEPGSPATDIKKAFHATSRAFHPDVNRHLEPTLHAQCASIAKRITEAYCVLRDPRRRKAYDNHLAQNRGLRMQLAEARAAHARQDTQERQGRTPEGRQLNRKAMQNIKDEDWSAASQNLQMALTFESDNAYFKEQLEEVRMRRKAARKKQP